MRRGSAPWPSWSACNSCSRSGRVRQQIPELVRGHGEQEISAAEAGLPAPLGGEAESVSSPAAPAEQRPAGFWFNVNAELVIYGATEPDASVTHWRPADPAPSRWHLQLPLLVARWRAHRHGVRTVGPRRIAPGRAAVQPPHRLPRRSGRRPARPLPPASPRRPTMSPHPPAPWSLVRRPRHFQHFRL